MATAATPIGTELSRSTGGTSGQEECLCWSKMQAEAGQRLDQIVARKEVERRAGAGIFLWGVGTAPVQAIAQLVRNRTVVPVWFSPMLTRPHRRDHSPERVVAWRSYIDANNTKHPLPAHSLVTSSEALGQERHFALMCWSPEPLELRARGSFDPRAYQNVSDKGGPIGASQVTALVRRIGEERDGAYQLTLKAVLAGAYWVKLADPIEVSRETRDRLATVQVNVETWRVFVHRVLHG